MKKILVFLLTGIMVVGTMTACGGNNNNAGNTEVDTEAVVNTEAEVDTEAVVDTEIAAESALYGVIDEIYANHSPLEFGVGSMEVDLADVDALTYYTGLSSADKISEVVWSESMIGSQAYSLVLVRVNDAADAQSVADEMYDNIDQRKWVCVEAGDKMVATSGDIAMLIMVDVDYAAAVTAQSMVDAFQAVCGGALDYTR